MAFNNLPPQAYTRETVAEAFEWMKSQSPSTRDLAKDANTLVSLYLNAKRHKRIKNMQPGDTAEFQNELKSLAKGIKQFNQDAEQSTPSLNSQVQRAPDPNISDAQKESIDQAIASLHFKAEPVQIPHPVQTTHPIQEPAINMNTQNNFINPQEILRTNQAKLATQKAVFTTQEAVFTTQEASPAEAEALQKPDTQQIISQTKSALNLSSDQEALNVLVAMGYEHIKSIFKF